MGSGDGPRKGDWHGGFFLRGRWGNHGEIPWKQWRKIYIIYLYIYIILYIIYFIYIYISK